MTRSSVLSQQPRCSRTKIARRYLCQTVLRYRTSCRWSLNKLSSAQKISRSSKVSLPKRRKREILYCQTHRGFPSCANSDHRVAHGTGTLVGDPVEYASVLKVLGGSNRSSPLMLSSLKGLIGHSECASGIMSLIKVLLMIIKSKIPKQANFSKINPAVITSAADNMTIPTSLQAWNPRYHAALINNYGASGSNASLVVAEAPSRPGSRSLPGARRKYPFWLCGLDDRALRSYSAVFRKFIERRTQFGEELSLADLSFNLSRQSNRNLRCSLLLNCRTTRELEAALLSYEHDDQKVQSTVILAERPLILCFGGQVSQTIELDRQLYDNCSMFRSHVDRCNTVCLTVGAESVFPDIFQHLPIKDPVKLQIMTFTIQYSCAKTWMECGARPVATIGHSFGELTALCISGILSLEDTLRLIIGRATVVRHSWGSEKGAMMAVEADLKDVEALLSQAQGDSRDCQPATIACYNGPRSFTLAGSSQAIDAVVDLVSNDPTYFSMRMKRLQVTNAFHSTLVEPLMDGLEASAKRLAFAEPCIPIWRATEKPFLEPFSPRFVADQ